MTIRRTLLKLGVLAALALPAIPALAQEKPEVLRFHTFMSPNSNLWVNGLKGWMDKVEKESDGRIKFEAYPAMQLGGAPATLVDQVRNGVVDVAWSLPGYTPGRYPRTEVFELPFFTYDGTGASKAVWEYVEQYAPDEFKGLHLLAIHTHGRGLLHTRDKLVKSADDLKGLKIRGATRKATEMLAAVGATPVSMPLPHIPESLSKGVIDGAVLPWEVISAIKVDELATNHTEIPQDLPALYNSTQFMFMNPARYNSLPDDLKKVIDNNSGLVASAFLGAIIEGDDPKGRQQALDRGNTIHVMGEAEAKQLMQLASGIEREWVEDMNKLGYDGQKLLDGARQLVEKHHNN